MTKKFKSYRKKKKKIQRILLFIIVVLLTANISFNYFYKKIAKHISEKDIINIIINNKESKIIPKNGMDFIVNYTLGIDLKQNKNRKIEVIPTMKEEPVVYDEPSIYIYNTHQTEEYRSINTNDYNVIPTVMHASLILQNRLSNLGIKSLVETNSIKEILDINGWNYNSSYKASKMLASDALEKNKSIKYVIDLHRDSIPEYLAKVSIDGKDYAKIMIVLGKGHDGYENNLKMAERIDNYLKEFSPEISRGIDIKVNSGIYNQDLSPNAVLIEIGGPYNDINSVSNSIEVLANVYKKVIDEDNGKKEET